jgi:UDP-galactopyranose mutase
MFPPIVRGLRLHGRACEFQGRARPSCSPLEQRLIAQADLVFTGGYSLFEAKRRNSGMPASILSRRGVDADHFGRARCAAWIPVDQRDIPGRGSASMASSTSAWTSTLLAEIADRAATSGRS